MGKINILDASVFNMLAAGEVVERPASVVKELVENSIDAGATVIDVTVEEGGTRLIEVSDNGIGIAPEDMRAAFLPHATSKLSKILDLDSLSTLGFRGEALASIASVSEVTAISVQRGADIASKLVLSGGKVTLEGAASRDRGTVISVSNLFFNTPARLKFLKKPSLEQKYIEETVRQLILANPTLTISLYADGERVLSHSGGSLFDAIVAAYGASNADRLIAIDPHDGDKIRVSGYVSAPDRTKSTRAYETIIVNGRSVSDVTIQTAVEKAYGDLLMKRAFPIFVLDIVLPFDEVDVNVHPSKTEVRFVNKNAVFGAVYHAVYDAVHSVSGALGADDISSSEQDADISLESPIDTRDGASPVPDAHYMRAAGAYDRSGEDRGYFQPRIDTSGFYSSAPRKPRCFRESAVSAYSDPYSASAPYPAAPDMYGATFSDGYDVSPAEEGEERVFDGKIVGQIFSTYIIVERDDVVYVIDQHAAHERLLYDRIYAAMVPEFTQPLLIPYKLILSAEETERFESLVKPLEDIGFQISINGASYVIEAVPEPISRVNFRDFFAELLAKDLPSDGVSLAALMRGSLCQRACKAAIKGGEALNRQQIERVLATLTSDDGKLPEKCPHGRPAVIALTKTDIEKLFKRIV